ncbi:MAG: hypothetical protein ACT4OF_13005 [Caulobacteraceae bacterium]
MSDANVAQGLADEPQLSGLSGLELLHDFHFVLPHLAAWGSVAEAFRCVGAELQSLQLVRQSTGFSGRCRIKSVTSEDARRLSGLLIESGAVLQASVEHLMLRSGSAS